MRNCQLFSYGAVYASGIYQNENLLASGQQGFIMGIPNRILCVGVNKDGIFCFSKEPSP